eukprot:6179982-Pleurochrysis_carterae.AAC.13
MPRWLRGCYNVKSERHDLRRPGMPTVLVISSSVSSIRSLRFALAEAGGNGKRGCPGRPPPCKAARRLQSAPLAHVSSWRSADETW